MIVVEASLAGTAVVGEIGRVGAFKLKPANLQSNSLESHSEIGSVMKISAVYIEDLKFGVVDLLS